MVNPVLPEARSIGYGRRQGNSPLGVSPNGGMPPRSFPNLLAWWSGGEGLSVLAEAPDSLSMAAWNPPVGMPGSAINNTDGSHRIRKGRIYPSKKLIVSGSDTYAMVNQIRGQTRNSTVAVLYRNRRQWAAAAPDIAYSWVWTFETATGTDVGLRLTQVATDGYTRWNWFDTAERPPTANADTGATGAAGLACGTCVNPSCIIVTVDDNGQIIFDDDGRRLRSGTNTTMRSVTGFRIGNGSQAATNMELLEVVVIQKRLTKDECTGLRKNLKARWGVHQDPTTALVVTGDSIIAGESYVSPTSYTDPTICERLVMRDQRLRVMDLTESSTKIAYGTSAMENDTDTDAAAKGGNGFLASHYKRRMVILQHGRNDIAADGASVATLWTAVDAFVTKVKTFDANALIFLGTVIATIKGTGLATQDLHDQACVDWNADIRANYAAHSIDGVIDWGADAAFVPAVGTTPYTNTTYYAGDDIHINGQQGATLYAKIAYESIAPFIR